MTTDRRHGTDPTGLDRGRSSGLDGLRFLASLWVLLFHVRELDLTTFGPLDRFVMGGGDTGVWMFFALSGYLLYRPFLTKRVNLREYALKRAARIAPGYYIALCAMVLVTWPATLFFDHALPYLTGTFTYSIPLRNLLGTAWTLSAEILFYLTLPLLARAARGREVALLGWLGVASILMNLLQRVTMTHDTEWLHGSYPTVFYAFVPGMLLAVAEVRRPSVFDRLARPIYLLLGAACLGLGSVSTIVPIPFATLLGAPLVMGWLLQHRVPFPRALAFGGGASYALYLWHWDLMKAFGLAGIPIAFVGAALSWMIVERPILARAHALAKRWQERAEPAITSNGTIVAASPE